MLTAVLDVLINILAKVLSVKKEESRSKILGKNTRKHLIIDRKQVRGKRTLSNFICITDRLDRWARESAAFYTQNGFVTFRLWVGRWPKLPVNIFQGWICIHNPFIFSSQRIIDGTACIYTRKTLISLGVRFPAIETHSG